MKIISSGNLPSPFHVKKGSKFIITINRFHKDEEKIVFPEFIEDRYISTWVLVEIDGKQEYRIGDDNLYDQLYNEINQTASIEIGKCTCSMTTIMREGCRCGGI